MDSTQRFNLSITVIGWLFIAFGLLAVASISAAAFNHNINLDLNVFGIPIGIGILRRHESGRKWALLSLWIYAIQMGAVGIIAFAHGPFETLLFGRQVGQISPAVFCLLLVPCLALVVWQQYILTRSEARQQFDHVSG